MYELIDETADFLVIYKKPDTSFHSESGEPGLFEFCKQQQGLSELYPVHRLDKVTSGLLVMAKTAQANIALTAAFRARKIEKYYLALSAKKPTKKQGLIKGDMAAARRGAFKLLTTQENPAITQFFSTSIAPGRRLFIVKPHTGKTHQIRVALKSIGAPIMGDLLYADVASNSEIDRVYLHAYSLGFELTGKQYRYTVLPREGEYFGDDYFSVGMEGWCEPWLLAWPKVAEK
jgi:tRNA pseudouridine32 synthase/23S rRNA pseudouridine746 synthase